MAKQETFQIQGSGPQAYEDQKVPSMFRPLAEATLRKVDVPKGVRVIDVACGTGIVSRLVAERVGGSGSVIGVDLNSAMIAVAEKTTDSSGATIEWKQGDVTALLFPDASFDVAFCQQGLQYFPDKVAALKEIRRVLKPGGMLALTVWSEVPKLGGAISDALGQYVNAEAAKKALAPFAFRDIDVIKPLFVEAGFSEIQAEILAVDRVLDPTDISIPAEIVSSGFTDDVEKLDADTRKAMVDGVGEALKEYRTDSGFSIPQRTHLIRATA